MRDYLVAWAVVGRGLELCVYLFCWLSVATRLLKFNVS